MLGLACIMPKKGILFFLAKGDDFYKGGGDVQKIPFYHKETTKILKYQKQFIFSVKMICYGNKIKTKLRFDGKTSTPKK